MPKDPQEIIQTLARVTLHGDQPRSVAAPPLPTVTLSRDHGSGGDTVARLLAERLGVEIYDRQILDAVAEAANARPELMAQLDEKVERRKDSWFYALFTGQNAFMTSYRHHLVNVLLGLSAQGGIIVGRGAHFVLANHPVLRLRIVGSEQRCAERLAAAGAQDEQAAREEVRRINAEREKFLWNLFRQRLNTPSRFDLVLNTDHFRDDWDAVTELVIQAMRSMGLPVGSTK